MMDQLRHKDGLLPKIDRLVLQFCETATHCDSLQAMRDGMKKTVREGYGVSRKGEGGGERRGTDGSGLDDRIRCESNRT
jgi:hypothetical protein